MGTKPAEEQQRAEDTPDVHDLMPALLGSWGNQQEGLILTISAANAFLGNTTKPKEILPRSTAAFMQSLGFLIKKSK